MWVLYNNDGQVITSIPHGEVARQGSSITVYIAFEKEYFHNILGQQSLIYSCTEFINAILSKITAQAQFDDFEPVLVTPQLYKFKRIKDNESICSFEEGKTYVVYKFDGGSQYTVDYGDHNLNLTFDFVENEEIVDSKTFGTIPIFLEKTYGGTVQDNVIPTEKYQLLLAKVQQMLTTKLNIEDEKVLLLKTDFTTVHNFAQFCSQDSTEEERDRIYFAKVNGQRALGIASSSNEVTIIDSSGKIYVSDGEQYISLVLPKINSDNAQIRHINSYNIEVANVLTANASLTNLNGEPTSEKNATTKKYVDNLYAASQEYTREEIRKHTEEILGGVEASGDTLKELFDLIKDNKDIIKVLQEATTKTEFDKTKTVIVQVLSKNYDYTFSAAGIQSVVFTIPSDVKEGYLSGFSIKIGNQIPTITFANSSSFPILYTLNGTQRPFSKITFQPFQTLLGAVMCDGINVYVYLKEMKNSLFVR